MRTWIFLLGLCGAASLSTIRLPVLVYLNLHGPPFQPADRAGRPPRCAGNPSQGRLIWTREDFLRAWAPRGEGYLLSLREDPVG